LRRKEGGFSIIGLMVSMTLLLIIIVAIVNSVTIGYFVSKRMKDRLEAQDIARNQLENTKIWAKVLDNFNNLIENDKWSAIPAQPAIPNVRPAIPAEPPSYRVYTNFIGNIILPNGRVKYAEQFLIKDLTTQNPSSEVVAKKITIRIYYANSQGDYVDTNFHKEPPGSGYIKRFENPLAELSEVIERPW